MHSFRFWYKMRVPEIHVFKVLKKSFKWVGQHFKWMIKKSFLRTFYPSLAFSAFAKDCLLPDTRFYINNV